MDRLRAADVSVRRTPASDECAFAQRLKSGGWTVSVLDGIKSRRVNLTQVHLKPYRIRMRCSDTLSSILMLILHTDTRTSYVKQ